jgi:hypothetical protein
MKIREKTLKAQRVSIWQAQFHLRAVRDRTNCSVAAPDLDMPDSKNEGRIEGYNDR